MANASHGEDRRGGLFVVSAVAVLFAGQGCGQTSSDADAGGPAGSGGREATTAVELGGSGGTSMASLTFEEWRLLAARQEEGVTEEEWSVLTAPLEGTHDVVGGADWCAREPINQEYRPLPELSCRMRLGSDYVYDCAATLECTRAEHCAGEFALCSGDAEAHCDYGIEQDQPCETDGDCTAQSRGSCMEGVVSTRCYPTGACQTKPQRYCLYLREACSSDAECVDRSGGRCRKVIRRTYCTADECAGHDTCHDGERCECYLGIFRCIPADCGSDSECGSGQQCILERACGVEVVAYRCTTANDECESSLDCDRAPCAYRQGRFQCEDEPCPPPEPD